MAVKRGKKQARRKDEPSVPGWIWLAVGLVGGAAIAVAVWVKMPHAVDDLMPHPNPSAKPPVASASSSTPEGNPPATATVTKKKKYDFYEMLPEQEIQIPDEELTQRVKAEQAANLAAKQQQGLASAASSSATDGSAALPRIAPAIPVPTPSTASPAVQNSAVSAPVAANSSNPPASANPTSPPTPLTPSATAAASEKSGQYLLQAGAFRNNAQADDLKARIAMLGLIGHVETVQTPAGEMHRVRLGPYATASELNAAKQKLSSNGMQPVAVRVK